MSHTAPMQIAVKFSLMTSVEVLLTSARSESRCRGAAPIHESQRSAPAASASARGSPALRTCPRPAPAHNEAPALARDALVVSDSWSRQLHAWPRFPRLVEPQAGQQPAEREHHHRRLVQLLSLSCATRGCLYATTRG